MYEKELSILNDNIDLIENKEWEQLWRLVTQAKRDWDAWHNILDIFYDKDINIDPFEGMTIVPNFYAMGHSSFSNNLVLPDTIITIGSSSFENTNVSDNIKLPKNLKTINDLAFAWCSNLTKLQIPDSVKEINDEAFANCYNLAEIILPTNLEILVSDAFAGTEIKDTLYINTDNKNLIWPKGIAAYGNLLDNYDICSSITGEYFGKFKDFRKK